MECEHRGSVGESCYGHVGVGDMLLPVSPGCSSKCSWGNTPILHACHRPAKTWQQPENFNFCIFTVLKCQNPHTQLKGDSSLKSFKGTQARGCCPHPARSVQNSVICGQLPNKPDLLWVFVGWLKRNSGAASNTPLLGWSQCIDHILIHIQDCPSKK